MTTSQLPPPDHDGWDRLRRAVEQAHHDINGPMVLFGGISRGDSNAARIPTQRHATR